MIKLARSKKVGSTGRTSKSILTCVHNCLRHQLLGNKSRMKLALNTFYTTTESLSKCR